MPSLGPAMPTKSTAAVSAKVRYAWIGIPLDEAQSSEASSTQAAPSVSGELLPAVSVPAASNAVLKDCRFSRVVSARTLLSLERLLNGATRSPKKPACHAPATCL